MSGENSLVIKNATVVNCDSTQENVAIFVKNGIVEYVGPESDYKFPSDCNVIDATGKFVLPGGIDPHTHLEMELEGVTTVDDYYHGSLAGVSGGTTTFIDFIIPRKGQSLIDAYEDWLSRASKKSVCDFGFHCAITSWSESVRDDMKVLCEEKGINSFKMYMAYKDVLMLNDGELYETFERCKEIGALAQVHAENGEIIEKNTVKLLAQGITGPEGHQLSRTEDVEAEAVNRACTIANQTKCPLYVVHVMSASAAEEVMRARQRWGERFIFGEALASGLGTDGRNYYHKCWRHAAGHVMSPPLRPDEETKTVLMKMLSA